MTNRRDFLQLSGMGLLATGFPDFLKSPGESHTHQLGVQLYTIREEIKKDIKGSLKRLAGIGFKNVETAFWPEDISVQTAAGHLKEFGFNVSSCHCEIPTRDNISILSNNARLYNCKNMIWHGWPEDKRYSTLEGTRELIKIYNESSKLASDNGLQFGLHNHWWEYKNKVGGRLVYEILNEELHEDIFFETDIYWVKVAGQDPAGIIKKLKKRIRLIHVKDGPAVWNDNLPVDNPDPMTPVGKGTINIPSVVNACTDHVQCMVVELDKSAIDVFDALKQSFDYLSGFKSISLK
ncbi:MAG: sugar phosphate isomerase/epimerase [Bacteroidota bacterium]